MVSEWACMRLAKWKRAWRCAGVRTISTYVEQLSELSSVISEGAYRCAFAGSISGVERVAGAISPILWTRAIRIRVSSNSGVCAR